MKRYVFLLLIFITTHTIAQDSFYGVTIDKEGATEIKDALKENNDTHVKLKGEIVSTCAKKGCWMTMKVDDSEEIRVTFKDYGFFVPTEGVEGKTAVIQGDLKKEITDVETLRHFAEDAGKSKKEIAAITEPKEEFSFVATGVIIEN
ncbi:MAG: DUF4920 domain-containing protein [Bacteroidota bacterium]